jgi:hypothetical protein
MEQIGDAKRLMELKDELREPKARLMRTLATLEWHQMPSDAGQMVAVTYAMDGERGTLYRRSHDRQSGRVTVEQAEAGDGEYAPWNGVLPRYGAWTPADPETAAWVGLGEHYQSEAWRAIAAAVDWTDYYPVIDRGGCITGAVVTADEEGPWLNVGDEAWISEDEAEAGGWAIDRDEGRARPPAK